MEKYFLIYEDEYEGVMMTTDTLLCIQEFDTEELCMKKIKSIKFYNEKNFYKCKILKVIKGEEIKVNE